MILNKQIKIKMLFIFFLLSIALIIILIDLFYYIFISLKAKKYNLNLFYFKQKYNLFFNSKKIYKIIKKINNEDEFKLLIHKLIIKEENPYNLKRIHKFNNECIICYDNSDDSNSDNTSIIIYEDEENYMNDTFDISNTNDIININLLKKYKEIYNYDSINKNFITLQCNHKFHLNCITKWIKIKNECPLCKKNILI